MIFNTQEMHSLIDKKNIYAVIGVSKNPEKYGHRVFKDLTSAGYDVYPVNPNETEILGHKVYTQLSDINEKIDVVIFVVPPHVTLEVLKEVNELGIKNVWFQPGSESPEALEYCETNDIKSIHDACIMIERKSNG
ncbi:MAG TPA: CoA-binding protein [Candidatus Dojkabacteria bacterium]|nr:CoA-binding protein [Candidatus Dojkabacteria bacterium]HRP36478.1 CoA-binding protein [Candidatus Dojkabacteria bacterium]HRP51134.1 CoA-binding protein [Candidatus Dojkabacteria bacterium]